jgi:hypothetical protein
MIAGGEKRFREGEAERAAASQFITNTIPAALASPIRAIVDRTREEAASFDAGTRAEEDRILAQAPFSARAYQIRRGRGIPDPVNTSAPSALLPE